MTNSLIKFSFIFLGATKFNYIFVFMRNRGVMWENEIDFSRIINEIAVLCMRQTIIFVLRLEFCNHPLKMFNPFFFFYPCPYLYILHARIIRFVTFVTRQSFVSEIEIVYYFSMYLRVSDLNTARVLFFFSFYAITSVCDVGSMLNLLLCE